LKLTNFWDSLSVTVADIYLPPCGCNETRSAVAADRCTVCVVCRLQLCLRPTGTGWVAGDRAIAGFTAANCVSIVLWKGVMYRCCRGHCARWGYDVQGVAGVTAI